MGFDTLHVYLVEARNVAAMDKSKTSDPYCVFKSSFNKQTFKSKVIKKTLAPKWDQEFKFFTSSPEGSIQMKMYDKDLFSSDEFMGEITLNLVEYSDGELHDKWLTLQNEPLKKKLDKVPGEVHVKVQFTGPPELQKPKESASKAATTATPSEKKAEAAPKSTKPLTIDDKYDLGKVIGRGAFSVVKEGIRKEDRKKYAIKCIAKKQIDKKELALLEREIDIMKKLQHPNIIQLMEVIDSPDTLYLVIEYAGGGELFDAIVNKGQYSEADAGKIIKQILEAIQYVHDHGIAHRDLKPENLLLSAEEKEDCIKIADFGLSKDFGQEQLQTSCGTPDYVAPEVLLGEPYDMSVDIWSIGVICYVLLCGFPPFYGETQKELFENIMSGTFDFPSPEWDSVSDAAKTFIKKILVVDASKRYTAEQSLNDPWLKDIANPSQKREMKRLESFSVTKLKAYNEKYKEQNKTNYNDVV